MLDETWMRPLPLPRASPHLTKVDSAKPISWSVSVSNPVFSGLTPGDSAATTLDIIGPQANQYPVAGTFSASITITPTLSAALQGSGVAAEPLTRNYTLIIPPVIDGDFLLTLGHTISQVSIPLFQCALPILATMSVLTVCVSSITFRKPSANFSETDTNITNLSSDISDGAS